MVTKKKGLYLGLLLSLLGIGNVMQAMSKQGSPYILTIKNKTPYKITFNVTYEDKAGEKYYTKELKSGKKAVTHAPYKVSRVNASVHTRSGVEQVFVRRVGWRGPEEITFVVREVEGEFIITYD